MIEYPINSLKALKHVYPSYESIWDFSDLPPAYDRQLSKKKAPQKLTQKIKIRQAVYKKLTEKG